LGRIRASWLAVVLLVVAAWACSPAAERDAPLALAASSLQESMTEAAEAYAAQGHPRPVVAFAASSALARQIESGAQADLFASADLEWMDSVEQAGLLRARTRIEWLGNRLVLVAPAATQAIALDPAAIDRALGQGRLAIADPDSVPAGRYGRAALDSLGLWTAVAARLARAENVRAALALVERGEAPLGIVYATDALAAPGVTVVATFPAASHPPIRYPLALLEGAGEEGQGFYRFLVSAEGRAIFARHGFTPAS
jgi:molybdate transport system substrate-binding protein